MAIGDSLATPNLWEDGTGFFSDAISGGTPRFISLPLRGGVTYSFLVSGTSGAFDAFLTLYDTLDNAQAVLATDDNSLDMISEPLILSYTIPVTGIYYLGCSSLGGDGSFFFAAFDDAFGDPITYFRSKITNKISDFFQNRFSKITNKIALFNVLRSKPIFNTFSAKDVHKNLIDNMFNADAVSKSLATKEEINVWSKVGYELFANGVLIGTFEEGIFTLTDIALADGDYEVEVRPMGNFYRNTVVKQRIRINCDAGGSGVTELFPLIYDLVSVIDNRQTCISWSIKPQLVSNTTKIGVWFGATSGIDISGDPDVSFSIGALLTYQYKFRQAVNQWVAVACYDGVDRGTKSEIELVWSTTLPDAPDFQHINEV